VILDGAILAGGRARRMGGVAKALLTVGGARIVDRQLAVLAPLVREVFVVAPAPLDGVSLRAVPDLRAGLGPLAGIEAALAASDADALLIVAGDMPALSPSLLAHLSTVAPEADAVAPRIGGRAEPLCARYSRRALPPVRARLDRGELAVHALLDELRAVFVDEATVRALDPSLVGLASVNTPDELARLEALLSAR